MKTPALTILTCLLILCAIGEGCSMRNSEREREDSARRADSIAAEMREANDLTSEAEAFADSILAGLSLERKAALTLMPAAYARESSDNMSKIVRYVSDLGVGGIVLLKGDLPAVAAIADTLAAIGHPAPFLAVDAENGLRMRFPDAPEFPWNRELGRLTDDQVLYEFGRELARECRIVGINMVLGPVMDIVPGEGSHGLMRKRSLGSDPRRVAELAVAYSRGVEDGTVMSVAKHFPGHGSASADSHKALGEISSNRQKLDSIDLYPFKIYSADNLSGVMVGHLYVSALDTVRRPAVVSPVLMQDILRKQLKFDGLVITDALNMEGALGVSAWQALAAGADLIIAPSNTDLEISKTVEAVKSGQLSEKILNDRCRRILFYNYLFRNEQRPKHVAPTEIIHSVNNIDTVLMHQIRDVAVKVKHKRRSRLMRH